jgi:hypothetical protein
MAQGNYTSWSQYFPQFERTKILPDGQLSPVHHRGHCQTLFGITIVTPFTKAQK